MKKNFFGKERVLFYYTNFVLFLAGAIRKIYNNFFSSTFRAKIKKKIDKTCSSQIYI